MKRAAEQHIYTQSCAAGYVTFIAAVFAISTEPPRALRIVESVPGAVSVGLIGAFGARLFGRPAGLTSPSSPRPPGARVPCPRPSSPENLRCW
jgi:hypothetical protein